MTWGEDSARKRDEFVDGKKTEGEDPHKKRGQQRLISTSTKLENIG